MKKNKTDFDSVRGLLDSKKQTESADSITAMLIDSMLAALNEGTARGLKFMAAYYGLGDGKALTLEGIGDSMGNGLTRERVRQIIDGSLSLLLRQDAGSRHPFKLVKGKFEEVLAASESSFILMDEFLEKIDAGSLEKPNAGTGERDQKGLIAFLNDAGIRQVVYRTRHYLYGEALTRSAAITQIQSENKKSRRAKTVEKMQGMAKTVTYVPVATREFLLKKAEMEGLALNRMYESILGAFLREMPCKSSSDFVKTQSWRARKGKAEWCQVGIYIDKKVFDDVKEVSAEIAPEAVSNMAFICQAFMWAEQHNRSE